MGRLILVPQYPTKLRYQEWWWEEFPKQFAKFFSKVIVLDGNGSEGMKAPGSNFAPAAQSVLFEMEQIKQYLSLKLEKDDILLLNDLSFPGFFSTVLFHKRPSKCFAICHATSKNKYDYFVEMRSVKYPIEKSTARLFDKIFVATKYHADKLNWSNLAIQAFPLPPFKGAQLDKRYDIVSVSRPGKQKRNHQLETQLQYDLHKHIVTPIVTTWREYYNFLAKSRILLITAKEETYGYQVIDAIANNCIPIAPNALSYPELLSKDYLYNTYNELKEIIHTVVHNGLPIPKLLVQDSAQMFYKNIVLEITKHEKIHT